MGGGSCTILLCCLLTACAVGRDASEVIPADEPRWTGPGADTPIPVHSPNERDNRTRRGDLPPEPAAPVIECNFDPDCDDDEQCTDDSCVAQRCVFVSTSKACDDGDDCTLDDWCVANGCEGDPQPPCDDGQPCTTDKCDGTGGCFFVPDHAVCEDGIDCTTHTCASDGGCLREAVDKKCADDHPCTADSCDMALGCQNVPDDALCSDGIACTNHTCDLEQGCVGTLDDSACDDADLTTKDFCHPVAGCLHELQPACGQTAVSWLGAAPVETTFAWDQPVAIGGDHAATLVQGFGGSCPAGATLEITGPNEFAVPLGGCNTPTNNPVVRLLATDSDVERWVLACLAGVCELFRLDLELGEVTVQSPQDSADLQWTLWVHGDLTLYRRGEKVVRVQPAGPPDTAAVGGSGPALELDPCADSELLLHPSGTLFGFSGHHVQRVSFDVGTTVHTLAGPVTDAVAIPQGVAVMIEPGILQWQLVTFEGDVTTPVALSGCPKLTPAWSCPP